MTFGSLFAGIGGIDLGLERGGLTCAWQVEIDPYCNRVLRKHWPAVRRHEDVRTFPPEPASDWSVDLICGGFPCQDISNAGRRAGIEGERSGLWSEYARIVRVLRPRFVLVENVAALLGRGLGRVVGDLAECGYDTEWDCLPAAAFGALHIRNRVFLLAYSGGCKGHAGHNASVQRRWTEEAEQVGLGRDGRDAKCVDGQGCSSVGEIPEGTDAEPTGICKSVPDADSERRQEQQLPALAARAGQSGRRDDADADNAIGRRHGPQEETVFAGRGGIKPSDWWRTEPSVGRVADGVPHRVDRLRGLGNAVVPQVAEWIGRQLMAVVRARGE